jgi:hypothetical protein
MGCLIFVVSLKFLSTLDDSKRSPPVQANLYVSEFDYSVICYEIRNKKGNQIRIASSVKEERNLPTWYCAVMSKPARNQKILDNLAV